MSVSKTIADPKPVGNRCIVQVLVPADRSAIITPESAKEKGAQLGEVIEVNDNSHGIQVQDIVIFNQGAGLEITHLFDTQGSKLRILHLDQDILGKARVMRVLT